MGVYKEACLQELERDMGGCVSRSPKKRVYVDSNNYDPMDTLAPLRIPTGFLEDTPENRANAALACCVQLTRRIVELEKRTQ